MDLLTLPLNTLIFFALIGYLSGSVPYGLLITKIWTKQDIRHIGSGNIGTTNVLRTGNKKLAIITLMADILKGLIVVLFAKLISVELAMFTGVFAIIGHMFPVWLKFKGGKGVATSLGVYLGISVYMGLFCLGIWILIAYLTRYSSFAALCAYVFGIFYALFAMSWFISLSTLIVTLLIFYCHQENIKRLLNKEEPKISFGKK